MQHGVNLLNMAGPSTLVDLAVTAERAGWDGVFVGDHLTWFEPSLPVHDPWEAGPRP